MVRLKAHRIVRSCFALSLASLASCAGDPELSSPLDLEAFGVDSAELGPDISSCSASDGVSGYSPSTFTLTINLAAAAAPVAVLTFSRNNVYLNGHPCRSSYLGARLSTTNVKKVHVIGTSGDDYLIVDLLAGSPGSTIFGSTGGITADLGSGTDTFVVRWGAGADKPTVGTAASGAAASNLFIEASGDKIADFRIASAEYATFMLGDGNDTFTAQGSASMSCSHLGVPTIFPVVTLSSLVATSTPIKVYGGGGDDIITGGMGDDSLYGGSGNDTFRMASVDDGGDRYFGDDGTDLVDYSNRSVDQFVSINTTTPSDPGGIVPDANDGLPGENDDIMWSVESLTTGAGNDTLVGNQYSNTLSGGLGADMLWGGPGNPNCALDIDTLNGGVGNDLFDSGNASDCADIINGGDGTDSLSYAGRSANLAIYLDSTANDGETNEEDYIKSDVEVLVLGQGDDYLSGSAASNEIHGGPGNDLLIGGAGDDNLYGDAGDDTLIGSEGADSIHESGPSAVFATFLAAFGSYNSGLALYDPTTQPAGLFSSMHQGQGADLVNGGDDSDTVSYSARTNAIAASLCLSTSLVDAGTECTSDNNDGDPTENSNAGENDNLVNIEVLVGGSNDDTFTGSAAAETFYCGAGNDTVNAGAGNDSLFGDSGNDILNGEDGDDTIDGISGDDIINGGSGVDTCQHWGTNGTSSACES